MVQEQFHVTIPQAEVQEASTIILQLRATEQEREVQQGQPQPMMCRGMVHRQHLKADEE